MQQVFSGRVTWLSSLLKETIDAQLFARSEHAPDQTELQPQHLQCSNDLSPACAIMPVFQMVITDLRNRAAVIPKRLIA